MDTSAVIAKAKEALKSSRFGGKPHVTSRFDRIKFSKFKTQAISDTAAMPESEKGEIDLYPLIESISEERAVFEVLRAFGNLMLATGGKDEKERWELKLCLPENEQIDAIQSKLENGVDSYESIVESLTTCMDRWVAVNIVNALKKNGVQVADSTNISLRTWGATSEYASRLRYHSIIPQLGVYAPKEMGEFGFAFAGIVTKKKLVAESSVAKALETIVYEITNLLR